MSAPRTFAFRPFEHAPVACARRRGRPDARPFPRSGHRVACTSGALYALGGYNPAHKAQIFRELWRFSLARRRWRLLAEGDAHAVPERLASSALCQMGAALLTFGGTGAPFGVELSARVHAYDLRAEGRGSFEELAVEGDEEDDEAPAPGYGAALLAAGARAYAFGGTDGHAYHMDVHRLDAAAPGRWRLVRRSRADRDADGNEPAPRYRHEVAWDGERAHVVGGGTADSAVDPLRIDSFDPETATWERSEAAAGPAPRKCHSLVQTDSHTAFALGGADGEGRAHSDVWRLELPTRERAPRWTRMERSSLPHALHFHASAATPEGCAYTFGGIATDGDSEPKRTRDVFKVWLRIPALSEICWEAALYYAPHLVDADRDKLARAGFPRRFIERLDF